MTEAMLSIITESADNITKMKPDPFDRKLAESYINDALSRLQSSCELSKNGAVDQLCDAFARLKDDGKFDEHQNLFSAFTILEADRK
jgi:hypothetical protein